MYTVSGGGGGGGGAGGGAGRSLRSLSSGGEEFLIATYMRRVWSYRYQGRASAA